MKGPLSPEEYGLRALALAAMLLSAAILAHLADASAPQAEPSATLRRCHRLARNIRPYPAAALRPDPPSTWCIHFAKNDPHRHPPPPPPPPPSTSAQDQIDPLYGEAKRLVPSGPNPLHN